MGSPVRIGLAWSVRETSTWRDEVAIVTATVHGVTIRGGGSRYKRPDALRDAVRMLREAAWKVIGERQPPDLVDLGDAFPFPAVSDAYKRGRRRWHKISEARAWDMLEVVPPRHFRGWPGFFMGEPADHVMIDGREVAVHAAIAEIGAARYCRELPVAAAPLAAALAELRALMAAEERAQLERANDANGAAVGAAGEWLTDITDPTG